MLKMEGRFAYKDVCLPNSLFLPYALLPHAFSIVVKSKQMKTDIEIARETPLKKIEEIAQMVGIDPEHIFHYGHHIAKVDLSQIDEEKIKKHHLILVTAITPNKAGIGKTTVSIGLALGMNKIGKKAIVALREPSLGPCFGMKGGGGWWRLRTGSSDGKHQPPFYRRLPCDYFGPQYDYGFVGQLYLSEPQQLHGFA